MKKDIEEITIWPEGRKKRGKRTLDLAEGWLPY